MGKKLTFLLLLLTVVFSTGCGTFFRKGITNDNLRSTREGAAIKERAMQIGTNAQAISQESSDAQKELKEEVKEGVIPSYLATNKLSRWERVDERAGIIDKLASLNAKSGKDIVNINSGTWYATVWFKVLMIVMGLGVLGVVAGYITYLAKSWGVINYVKYANEGLAEGMAALIDKNPSIDNRSISHGDLRNRMSENSRYES